MIQLFFGSRLLLHHLDAPQVHRVHLAKASFIHSHEVRLWWLDDLLYKGWRNHGGRVRPLDVVQVVTSDIFIVVFSSCKVEHIWGDLELLSVVVFLS